MSNLLKKLAFTEVYNLVSIYQVTLGIFFKKVDLPIHSYASINVNEGQGQKSAKLLQVCIHIRGSMTIKDLGGTRRNFFAKLLLEPHRCSTQKRKKNSRNGNFTYTHTKILWSENTPFLVSLLLLLPKNNISFSRELQP